jgi:hypothetical protein
MMETKMTKRIAAMMRMVVGSIRNTLLGQVVKKTIGGRALLFAADARVTLQPSQRRRRTFVF